MKIKFVIKFVIVPVFIISIFSFVKVGCHCGYVCCESYSAGMRGSAAWRRHTCGGRTEKHNHLCAGKITLLDDPSKRYFSTEDIDPHTGCPWGCC